MLKKAEQLGWIKGLNIERRGDASCVISHILYADDSLLICEAKEEQVFYLKGVLLVFEAVTGLKVNLAKSSMFSTNAEHCIGDLAELMRCEVEQLSTSYLGLPLGARKNEQRIWQGVVDRCCKKLIPWKKQYLFLRGRLTLVSSVMDGIPTYLMSLFQIPVSVEKKLNTMRSNFLWEVNAEKRKLHLVKWQKVMTVKKGGGLGVRNLRFHNKSLLINGYGDVMIEKRASGRIL